MNVITSSNLEILLTVNVKLQKDTVISSKLQHLSQNKDLPV